MRVKTLAVQINEDTYPIAVACLPGHFVESAFAEVEGAWLVINDLVSAFGDEGEGSHVRHYLDNRWLPEEEFKTSYEVINRKAGAPAKNAFVEVDRLPAPQNVQARVSPRRRFGS